MGYETRMYIAQSFDKINSELDPDAQIGCMVLGMVDLCKTGNNHVGKLICQKTKEQGDKVIGYFYSEDGNTHITHDRYDAPIVKIDPKEFLKALWDDIEKDTKEGNHPYRRFIMAAALLENTLENFPDDEDIVILTFGH